MSDEQWRAWRTALADEARAWTAAASLARAPDEAALTGALASAVHLAYHLGAIRQIDQTLSGPPAKD